MNKNISASNSNGRTINTQHYNTRTNTRTNNSLRSTGYTNYNVFGLILLVIVILVILFAGYWSYQIYASKTIQTAVSVEALNYVKDGTSNFTVGSGAIPNSRYSNEYSISMWLNIHDYSYNYGKEKYILRRGPSGSSILELVLGDTANDLIARVRLQNPPSFTNTLMMSKFDNIESMTLQNFSQNFSYIGKENNNAVTEDINPITPLTSKNYKNINNNKNDSCCGGDNDCTRTLPESQVINNDFYSIISGNKVIQENNIPQSYSNFADISTTPITTTTIPTITIPTTIPTTTQSQINDKNNNNNVGGGGCLVNDSINGDPTVGTCVYKMIPLQKWVHVIISVYNQVVDIYIDGVLASSCILKGFPTISTDDINITPDGGFSGQISRVTFYNTAMTVSNARDLYNDGPVPSTNILKMIPNWIWYVIIILVIIIILYTSNK